jgi:hypothetical protein
MWVEAGRQPVVAVFDFETQRIDLEPDLLMSLSDYLAAKLVETGKYQVVPRSQFKERLFQQKKGTYKKCYDQSCQIELGRELAAEKIATTQIIQLGGKCTISFRLYDLKKATTQTAKSRSGGCTEPDLLATLDILIKDLGSSQAAVSSPPVQANPAPKQVSAVTVNADSAPTSQQNIKDLRTRTEWFAVSPVVAAGNKLVGLGVNAGIATLRFGNFFWNLIHTRIGLQFFLDSKGAHQFRIGGGIDYMYSDLSATDPRGMMASPCLSYYHQGSSFGVGLDIKTLLWVSGNKDIYGDISDYYPWYLLISVPFVF